MIVCTVPNEIEWREPKLVADACVDIGRGDRQALEQRNSYDYPSHAPENCLEYSLIAVDQCLRC